MKSSKSALAGLIRFLPLMGERVTARPNSAGPPAGRGNGSRAMVLLAVLLGLIGLNAAAQQQVATNSTAATPSRSTTIALTSDETRLVVVNRDPEREIETTLQLADSTFEGGATAYEVTGESPGSINDFDRQAVAVAERSVQTGDRSFEYGFPACSITVLRAGVAG